jgi:hypothetical protein
VDSFDLTTGTLQTEHFLINVPSGDSATVLWDDLDAVALGSGGEGPPITEYLRRKR